MKSLRRRSCAADNGQAPLFGRTSVRVGQDGSGWRFRWARFFVYDVVTHLRVGRGGNFARSAAMRSMSGRR